jgi:hypothetical protein
LSFFSSFAYFLLCHSILQEEIMTAEEFAQMSNCNLVKSIHNKWLQASGSKGGDLNKATMNDYIRAFLQVVAYHQFLKGGVGGDGPSKKNSSFDAINVVLNVLVIPLFYKSYPRHAWRGRIRYS